MHRGSCDSSNDGFVDRVFERSMATDAIRMSLKSISSLFGFKLSTNRGGDKRVRSCSIISYLLSPGILQSL